MSVSRILVLATVLAACGKEEPDPADAGDPGETAEPTDGSPAPSETGAGATETGLGCHHELLSVWPEPTDAYVLGQVVFSLDVPDPGASVAVTGPDGAVPGATTLDEAHVVWTPDEALEPSTDYTATLTWSCPEETHDFRTSDVGAPLDVDVVGQTYAVPISDVTVLQPPGIGPLLTSAVGNNELLAMVTGLSGSTLDLRLAISDGGGVQYPCSPTSELAGIDFDDPAFSGVGSTLEIDLGVATMVLQDYSFGGAFSADGTRLEGVSLTGVTDTDGLGDAIGLGSDPYAICNLVAATGTSCVDCPDTGADTCLELWFVGGTGVGVPGSLTPRSQAAIDQDPSCN